MVASPLPDSYPPTHLFVSRLAFGKVWKLSFDESGCGSIRGTVALELEGHKAFTTKDCPFLLFTQQGGRPAGGHAHPAPPPPPPFESSPGLGSPSGGGGGAEGTRREPCPPEAQVAGGVGGGGDLVCSGSEDAGVYVWSLRYRRLLRVLRGHRDVVSAVAWAPLLQSQGQSQGGAPGLLATASDDYTVRLWGRRATTARVEY